MNARLMLVAVAVISILMLMILIAQSTPNQQENETTVIKYFGFGNKEICFGALKCQTKGTIQ